MKPNYKTAEADAIRAVEDLVPSDLEIEIDHTRQSVPRELFDYFFKTQVDIEKGRNLKGEVTREARMNYREYAKRLWQELIDPQGQFDPQDPTFLQFQANLIHGLRDLDMSQMVYADIPARINDLVEQLEPTIQKAILWSRGDIDATGYQVEKIRKSTVTSMTRTALKKHLQEGEAAAFKDRTEYLVADDKPAALRQYLSTKTPPVKIAVVEDSVGNLDKVQAMVQELFGDQGEVIPIWTLYSRSGRRALRETFGDGVNTENATSEQLKEVAGDRVPIRKFTDLIDDPAIKASLQGAELVIDFDGVINDHIQMRNAQAQVKLAAIERVVQDKFGKRGQEAINYIVKNMQALSEGREFDPSALSFEQVQAVCKFGQRAWGIVDREGVPGVANASGIEFIAIRRSVDKWEIDLDKSKSYLANVIGDRDAKQYYVPSGGKDKAAFLAAILAKLKEMHV